MDEFLKQLEQANIQIRKRISGTLTGNYKSYVLGDSYDFYGVRQYYKGDNIKNIDWKAFARTNKIYTKLFTEQKQINVTVLIDNSKSMGFEDLDKWNKAKMCAVGISYITLKQFNKLNLYSFNDSINMKVSNLSGKKMFNEILKKISSMTFSGNTNFNKAILSTDNTKGIIFIITDLLSTNIKNFLDCGVCKYEKVVLIHIMGEKELNPIYKGKIKLIDSETLEPRIVYIGNEEIDMYKNKVKKFIDECKDLCTRRNIKYVFSPKYNSPVEIILKAIEVE